MEQEQKPDAYGRLRTDIFERLKSENIFWFLSEPLNTRMGDYELLALIRAYFFNYFPHLKIGMPDDRLGSLSETYENDTQKRHQLFESELVRILREAGASIEDPKEDTDPFERADTLADMLIIHLLFGDTSGEPRH